MVSKTTTVLPADGYSCRRSRPLRLQPIAARLQRASKRGVGERAARTLFVRATHCTGRGPTGVWRAVSTVYCITGHGGRRAFVLTFKRCSNSVFEHLSESRSNRRLNSTNRGVQTHTSLVLTTCESHFLNLKLVPSGLRHSTPFLWALFFSLPYFIWGVYTSNLGLA